MQQIINFIIRNKTFLLFLLLFTLSLTFTIQTHSYHKSKFINSANFLTGGVYNSLSNINNYFGLKTQNEILLEENSRLNAILHNSKSVNDSSFTDRTTFNKNYRFTPANILKNSFASSKNVLLLNKGFSDSIQQDFGVISSKGIVGIIDHTSKKYATVLSILNTSSKISAQLKKTNHFGTLTWNGQSPYFTQLIDIPKIAPVNVGDTIVTSGRSSIFPKGISIGIIHDFKLDAAENYYEINIKLFNDMTNLEHVYVIENTDIQEITNLLNTSQNE
ncbi:MAG: rod shape-determining protein MreC [Flavobacteriales bacterium]|nr:rod shape-determining protein MreC [Flavobacteriia bacterium]NCP05654.1 rod shape-determining protein MreC [Flavobacteriales bacterium]PIV93082.1 MAG: rod shape-determining protein MreC [Flavobacteriaceae bacterium CG17_big_fil_post_rev_8_21_14_2_50_33_15]PIY11887.1 MAG: rod shape-determining protein MreC [Flavobacteriaceae bacterium CG_4_10_14_3_um_filter_33_47]PJB18305.1 MAG: rod shape-determining protein MreC [Flavobacteriaceae bacterium CG_4_9_14_3_um_filter_33_16]